MAGGGERMEMDKDEGIEERGKQESGEEEMESFRGLGGFYEFGADGEVVESGGLAKHLFTKKAWSEEVKGAEEVKAKKKRKGKGRARA